MVSITHTTIQLISSNSLFIYSIELSSQNKRYSHHVVSASEAKIAKQIKHILLHSKQSVLVTHGSHHINQISQLELNNCQFFTDN